MTGGEGASPGDGPRVRSENPLHPAFWFGAADPRPLALFRILLGATLLHDLADYSVDLRAFVTDAGMLPRGAQLEPRAFGVFELIGAPWAVAAVFGLGTVVTLAFTAGYRTRLATVLAWLFFTSLHTRNLYVTDGGDDLVRYLLFLSCFADTGACLGLDTALGRRPAGPVPALGLRFLQLHVALLYFCAARLKFRAGWLSSDVIYQCLQLDGFVRPPGALLGQAPSLCFALGVLTLVLEWVFAFFAFSPVRVALCRAFAIAAGLLVQLGILATMRVGIFTEAMLVVMLLFVQPEWLDRAALLLEGRPRLVRWLRGGTGANLTPPPGKHAGKVPNLELVAALVLSFQFVSLAWGPFIAKRIPPPAWVTAPRHRLWLNQPFGLFDVVYAIPTWSVPGTAADGRQVDVLPVVAPELVPRVAWSFSRWYKFTFKERERPFLFDRIGDYLCREYERRSGTPLASLVILETLTPPRTPGKESGAPKTRERWKQDCGPASHPR